MVDEPRDVDGLRESRARIVATANAARRQLERQLHDGPQQHLVAMAVKLRLIENAIDAGADDAKQMLAELRAEVQETVQQLRDIATAIFPPLLGDRGLAEALRAAAARDAASTNVEVEESASGRFPAEVEAAVYFAVVDAIHINGSPLTVRLAHAGDELEVRVEGAVDDAALVHVEDRVQTVGGQVEPSAGGLTIRVPVA